MDESKHSNYLKQLVESKSVDNMMGVFTELHTSQKNVPFKWFIVYLKFLLKYFQDIEECITRIDVATTILTFMNDNRSCWSLDNNSKELKKLFYVVFWKLHELKNHVDHIIQHVPQESKQKFLQVIRLMKQTCFSTEVAKKMCPHAFIESCFSSNSNNDYNVDSIIDYLENMTDSFIDRRNSTYSKNISSLKYYIDALRNTDYAMKWRYIFRLYVKRSINHRCIATTCTKNPCTSTIQFPSQVCHVHQKKYNQLFRCMLKLTPMPIDIIHLTVKFAV